MGVYAEHGWLKIKNPNYSQSEGRHEMFTAFHERRKSGKIVSPKKGSAYHYRSKLLIPRKADGDFRFTNRLLYH